MKRIDVIKNMTTREIAEQICGLNLTSDYCNSDCEQELCDLGQQEIECCIKWLEKEED